MSDNSNNSNNNGIPPPRPVKQSGFLSGITSGIGNLFGTSSPKQVNNQPNAQPEDDSFKYSIEMPENFPLKTEFTNLAKAINDKNDILKLYQDLLPALQYLDQLLTQLGSQRIEINNEKTALESRIEDLNKEKDQLKNNIDSLNNNRQFGPTREDFESNEFRKKEMADKLAEKDAEIADAKSKLEALENASVLNETTIETIRQLVFDATKYINGMKPKDKTNILELRKLVNKMQDTVQADRNAKGYLKIDNNIDNAFEIVNPLTSGGYRYSSSQMRRKSTARRSSASGSYSSKRRHNKKRTAKKMLLGGKRMKKTKSTKRKNHKKH